MNFENKLDSLVSLSADDPKALRNAIWILLECIIELRLELSKLSAQLDKIELKNSEKSKTA
jgi:hypothetical protein